MQFTNSTIRKFNNKVKLANQDDDDEDEDNFLGRTPTLGYFKKSKPSDLIEIPIDEEFKSPSYYRAVTHAIREAGEDDVIRYYINSPGGRLDGLMSLLSAMWMSDATTEAYITGFCDSSASFLTMHCDNVYVSPVASMLVHNAMYGTGFQKAADIQNQVQHYNDFCETFFRDTYKHFLTDEEIQKCLDGYQLYLNAEQIVERLQNKFNILQAIHEGEQSEECESNDSECNQCEGCYDKNIKSNESNKDTAPGVKPKTNRSKKQS